MVAKQSQFLRQAEGGICVAPDFLLGLLTELGRHRALADHETDIVEAIVCRGHRSTGIRIRWTKPMDRRLLQASRRRGGVKAFALANSMTENAAHVRLKKLRKDKGTGSGVKG